MSIRRDIKSYSPRTTTTSALPQASSAGDGGNAVGGSNDAIVLTLSIALGVSLIVVIALVCVYVSRNNGDNVCQDGNSDVQYVDVDILAGKSDTVLAAASTDKHEQQPAPPVVLNGPLQNVKYDSVKSGGTVAASVTTVTTAIPAPAATPLGVFKKITADALRALVDKDEISIIVIASAHCGACKALLRSLEQVDASDIHVLDASELQKLPADLKKEFESPYVPQFWTIKNKKNETPRRNHIVKGKTGAMPANAIAAYIAEQKKA